MCVSLSSCAVWAGHADRGGHRLCGVRDRSPADRSALVHLLAHRYGQAPQGRACRVLWATAQGREGKGPASACPGLFIFLLSSYSGVFQQLLPWAAITYQLSDTRPSLKGDVMYYGIKFAWIILNTGLENSPGTWVKLSISGLCIIIINISVFQI